MNIILAALMLGADPVPLEVEVPATEMQAEVPLENRHPVNQIRMNYQAGKYADFLKQMEESFQNSQKEGGLQALADMRIGLMGEEKRWEELMESTLNERNRELQKVVEEEEGALKEKVASATAPLREDVKQALSRLASLHATPPGKGSNEDENQIIAIDFEYEYKALHLDMPMLANQKVEELREKHLALKMEQLDKMVAASQNFEDRSLRSAVHLIHSQLDSILIQNWDSGDLHALTRKSEGPTEEKIASVLTKYREKFSDLSKAFLEKQVVENEKN